MIVTVESLAEIKSESGPAVLGVWNKEYTGSIDPSAYFEKLSADLPAVKFMKTDKTYNDVTEYNNVTYKEILTEYGIITKDIPFVARPTFIAMNKGQVIGRFEGCHQSDDIIKALKSIKPLNSVHCLEDITNELGPTIVYFWNAEYYSMFPPSMYVEMIEHLYPTVKLLNVNVGMYPDIAGHYSLSIHPTFIVMNKGQEIGRSSGCNGLGEIKNLLQSVA